MMKTAFIPFILTVLLYIGIGFTMSPSSGSNMIFHIFKNHYNLSFFTVIPAVIIVVFSLFKINVRITMGASSLAGLLCAVFFQHIHTADLLKIMLLGFQPENAELAKLMAGGGVLSMIRVSAIICISSCYSGIFKGTHFLDGMQKQVRQISNRITVFGGILLTSLFASAIACNQTLAVMLTHQVCDDLMDDKERFASYLEDTAVVIAPLMPWSIAITVPLTSIGAPAAALLTAFYLYLIPLWNCAVLSFKQKRHSGNR